MHSIPLVALGTGLLWFGWYGFNAGSELKVDAVTGQAFLNTDMAASFAGRVAADGLGLREEAQVRRAADRGGRRTGDDHACGGLCHVNSAVIIGIASGVSATIAVNLKNR